MNKMKTEYDFVLEETKRYEDFWNSVDPYCEDSGQVVMYLENFAKRVRAFLEKHKDKFKK